MNYTITSRLELNLNDLAVPVPFATNLASKHRMAAIVVYDPNVIIPLLQQRMSSNARWKVILALDFPFGNKYVLEKFKQLPKDFNMLSVDGFDILLSAKTANNTVPSEIEVRNEIQIIKNFVHSYNKQCEVRFAVDALSKQRERVESALKVFKTTPPAFIRLDHNLEMPTTKANLETITKALEMIKLHTPTLVKVGTNVTYEIIEKLKDVQRFDVTVKQAQDIIHRIENEPAKA